MGTPLSKAELGDSHSVQKGLFVLLAQSINQGKSSATKYRNPSGLIPG